MPWGVMYKYSLASSEAELDSMLGEGWSESIEKAAKLCGPSAIYKKRVKPRRGVNRYAKGLPLVLPTENLEVDVVEEKAEELPTEVYETVKKVEAPVVDKPKIGLSPEKLEEANYLIDSGKKLKDIAIKYGVSWQYLASKRRKK